MTILWNRREVVSTGVSAASLLLLPSQSRAALSKSTLISAPFIEVETANGKVRGGQCRGALAFKGIPYAGSVSGKNRFKVAPPVQSWTGVFDATHLGPPALQRPNETYGEQEPAQSEDCLVLNVWTPAVNDHRKRPVMLYLHGGGYVTGSAGSPTQDGSKLAATYDVVVVACNHRLGLMGYLYLGELDESYAESANAGMQDAVATLNWIKANIAQFGGDPDNVTVFGESGGGGKTGTLMCMPQAKGLFHKAGIESGAQLKRTNKNDATETTLRMLKALSISPKELHRLTELPIKTLLDWQIANADNLSPLVDGRIVPIHPFDPVATPLAANIPLMIGVNHNEATFNFRNQPEIFSMSAAELANRVTTRLGDKADRVLAAYHKAMPTASPSDMFIAIATAESFGNDTIALASRKAVQPAPVYLYRYDYESNVPIKGTDKTLKAGHASDIGPTFYNYDQDGLHGNGAGLARASANLSALWTSFARSGTPSAEGVPTWPRYNTKTRPTMLVNTTCKVVNDLDAEIRKMWESL
jgi:para-nitrobenzyl esterase